MLTPITVEVYVDGHRVECARERTSLETEIARGASILLDSEQELNEDDRVLAELHHCARQIGLEAIYLALRGLTKEKKIA